MTVCNCMIDDYRDWYGCDIHRYAQRLPANTIADSQLPRPPTADGTLGRQLYKHILWLSELWSSLLWMLVFILPIQSQYILSLLYLVFYWLQDMRYDYHWTCHSRERTAAGVCLCIWLLPVRYVFTILHISSCFFTIHHVSSHFFTILHVSSRFFTILHVSSHFLMFLHVSTSPLASFALLLSRTDFFQIWVMWKPTSHCCTCLCMLPNLWSTLQTHHLHPTNSPLPATCFLSYLV